MSLRLGTRIGHSEFRETIRVLFVGRRVFRESAGRFRNSRSVSLHSRWLLTVIARVPRGYRVRFAAGPVAVPVAEVKPAA